MNNAALLLVACTLKYLLQLRKLQLARAAQSQNGKGLQGAFSIN